MRLGHGTVEDYYVGKTVDTYDRNAVKNGTMTITDYHQHVAHSQFTGDQYRNVATNLIVRESSKVMAQAVAHFLQRLDSATESDGSTVLDNTLVVWTSQMGCQAAHQSGRLPYVLAGGLGEKVGTFRMGRFVDYAPGGVKSAEDLDAAKSPVAANVLLNSVQRTFGIVQDVFGENLNAKVRGYLPRAT